MKYSEAFEEFVADSMEKMLTDKNAVEKLAALRIKDKTVFDKLREGIKKLVDKVKREYANLRPDSAEGKIVADMADVFGDIQDLFLDALDDASNNFQKAEKNTATNDGVKKNSIRLTNEDLNDYLRAGNRKNKNKISAIGNNQKIILTSEAEIKEYIYNSINKKTSGITVAYGKVNGRLSTDVEKYSDGKINIKNNYLEIVPYDMQHSYEQHHIAKEKGDIDLEQSDFENIPEYFDEYDELLYAITYASGQTRICVSKRLPQGRIIIIETVSKSRGAVQFKNAIGVTEEKYKNEYLAKYKKKRSDENSRGNESSNISLRDSITSNNSVSQENTTVNNNSMQNGVKNSLRDSTPTKNDDIHFSKRDFSYQALISKPNMKITTVDDRIKYKPTSTIRKNIVNQAIKNAVNVGKINENGNVVISVNDIDTDVILGKSGLRHGLDRRFDIIAPITLNAGQILKNSVKINELIPKKDNYNDSYVLVGVAKNQLNEPYIVTFVVNRTTNEVATIDVLYAINAKTEPAGSLSPSVPAKYADHFTDSAISITNLLDYVNKYFPDVLPEDILKHYGYGSRPEGSLGKSALFSERGQSVYELLGENKRLQKENNRLKDKNEYFNQLLKLQRKITHGKIIDRKTVEKQANVLLKNTQSKMDKKNLTDQLYAFYTYIIGSEQLVWEDVLNRAGWIANDLLEAVPQKVQRDEYAQVV